MVDAEQLAKAVIKQALADSGVGMESGQRIGVSEVERTKARSFLTATAGSWKEAREFWCSLADLDEEKLRTGTMRILGIPAQPAETDQKRTDDRPLQLFYPVPKPEKRPRARKPQPLAFSASGGISKRSQVLAMLQRPEGVSLDEIVARFGWKRTTAQTSIGYDLHRFGVRGVRGPDGRYRAVEIN